MEFSITTLNHLNNYEAIPESGCHIFMGYVNEKGYGRIGLNKKLERMHRVSYEYHKGKIPEGLHVLHSCDVKCCINPEHLSLGTHLDNMKQAVNRNRMKACVGSKHPATKLTEAQVRDIKFGFYTTKYYMRKYAITKYVVYDIKNNKSWKHIKLCP